MAGVPCDNCSVPRQAVPRARVQLSRVCSSPENFTLMGFNLTPLALLTCAEITFEFFDLSLQIDFRKLLVLNTPHTFSES